MSYTHGPWRPAQVVEGDTWVECGESPIATVLIPPDISLYAEPEKAKAVMMANARLIASAPALYKSLQTLLYDIDCLPSGIKAFLAWEHIKAGEAAIELAEGLQEPQREGE